MSAPPICWSPTAPTWCWPRRLAFIRAASAPCACRLTRAWPAWSRSRCCPVAVDDATSHPRFKYFKESGEEITTPSSACRSSTAAFCRAFSLCRPRSPASSAKTKFACSWKRPSEVAPVVSEARTLDRFIAPAQERLWSLARNLWWSWDHDCISLFRDLNPDALAAAESESHLPAQRDPAGRDRAPRHGAGPA